MVLTHSTLHQAPGEAEAELAMLNRRGDIDIVITDDVDCLLYGATTISKFRLDQTSTVRLRSTHFLLCRRTDTPLQ